MTNVDVPENPSRRRFGHTGEQRSIRCVEEAHGGSEPKQEDVGNNRRLRKFLKIAQDLRAKADCEDDIDIREKYLEVAFQWVMLADEVVALDEPKNASGSGRPGGDNDPG